MRGHIREVGDGVWEIMWDAGPDPVTGKRRQRSKRIQGSRLDAEVARDRIIRDVAAGKLAASGRMTLERFVGEWLPQVELTVKPATAAFYRQKLDKYVIPHLGNRRLSSVRGGDLNVLYARLLESGGSGGRPLSASTVRHAHRSIRRLYRDAVRWGLVTVNPAEAADPPRATRPELTTWSAEQVSQFVASLPRDRWFAGWVLAVTTGMRRGEVLGLRWGDIEGSELRVRRTWLAAGEFSEPKTKAGRRTIVLDDATLAVLAEHRRTVAADRLEWGPDHRNLDLVVAWPDGSPVDPNLWSKWFSRHAAAAGLPAIRFHDLRHTWATLALQAGVPAKIVSERLGHAGIAITLDLYTHRVDELHSEAAARVAGLIGL